MSKIETTTRITIQYLRHKSKDDVICTCLQVLNENDRLRQCLNIARGALMHPRDGWFDNAQNDALSAIRALLGPEVKDGDE